MLLTIDPEFRRDFKFLGPYELARLVEERFREPVEKEQTRIFKELEGCKLEEGSSVGPHVLKIEGYIGELYKLGHPINRELSINILLDSLISWYDMFIQIYRKGNQDKTIMKMHSMLTMYESFIEIHSSTDSATSGLSSVMTHIKKRSRSSVGPNLRCLKLGIHRVEYSHRKIGRCSKAKLFGNSGISKYSKTDH
ncbi:hypothetical protein L2E82_48284 [Cichorium intybus]|uniref:Uncharacterized protein n=1 Tax=Cichorium intybus TaxID=13427 RepID=A0ACB8YY34_CICIN|nr:hypothetical protein L2E82_48284 [Cichorium intybus]